MRYHRSDYDDVDLVLNLEARGMSGPALTLTADSDLHFFPLWRGMTVRYPAEVGMGLGCLAVIAALGAVAARARSLRWKRVLGTVWGLTWRALSASAAAGLVELGAMAMNWAPDSGLGPNPLLVWMFAVGALIGAGLTVRFVVRRWKGGFGAEATAAVLLLLVAACAPFMVLMPGAAYVLVLTTLVLALTALAPRRLRPVVGALAAFVIAVIFAPTILLIHEMLSLNMVWATVFFAIVPVAPLALVLLQAGSRGRAAARSSAGAKRGIDVAPAAVA